MAKKLLFMFSVFLVASVLGLGLPSNPPSFAAPPEGKPIIIGYVGNIASPGTKPCMDIQKYAVDEINKAGGILGRPVKYVVLDGKGDTSLSVDAARRLLMEEKAAFISVEGRSEICLAAQENSAALFKEYPHILVFNGPMASELTARILDNYDKYKFSFRDWDPEPAHYAWLEYILGFFRDHLKGKKVAFLWEDLDWTLMWRRGIDYLKLPTWEEVARDKYGLEVVYSKAVKPRGTMYLPILQEIAAKKADVVWYVSSWFTDTESFAKQWADSAAQDIPVLLYGGVAATRDYWRMTGGKALGILTGFTESEDLPITDKTLPFVVQGKKLGIPLQTHVHLAYADIYHFKAAIERAGGVEDMEKLITAMEDVETVYSLGKLKYETKKIKPFYRSKVMSNPENAFEMYPQYFTYSFGQWQKDGKFVFVMASPGLEQYASPKNYIPPAELRKK